MRASLAGGRDHKEAQALRPSHGPGPPRPHGSHSSQNTPRCYKTLYDKDLGAKETIRRYNGHIPGHPKYDVKLPLSDPRNHYIQYRTVPQADLCVPSFTVDRNTLFYPKVEVALFELNDNVNNAFLQQLAVKIAFPVDLEVFYHPITKKHLAMAMVVFTTFEEAQRFVREYNGKSVMGGQIFCCHDPYFALLSHRYEDVTGEKMRIPIHLKNLEEGILNMRRGQVMKEKCASRRNRTSPLTPCIVERNQEEDMDMESPSGSDVETQECMSKLEQRPSTSGCSTSKRKRSSTESSHTPHVEPALVVPPVVPLPSSTGFTVRVPPPAMPSLRTGAQYHLRISAPFPYILCNYVVALIP